jgi:hypothetical protein
MNDRHLFGPMDIAQEIWAHLDLPPSVISSLSLPGIETIAARSARTRAVVPSSFKIGHLAQSTIALSALSAALVHVVTTTALSNKGKGKGRVVDFNSPAAEIVVPRTTVPLRHALLEFQCERLYTLAGKPPEETWGPIGGLHPTADGGYVRMHDNFPHHRKGILALLGLDESCVDRGAVSERTRKWKSSVELETVAVEERGLAVYALRSFEEWDQLPQAKALAELPVGIRRLDVSPTSRASSPSLLLPVSTRRRGQQQQQGRCLSGLRVLELSRVIAAPVAGKTLAAHGADVLWVTSPNLPDIPGLDREFVRGKRSVQLDLNLPGDKERLLDLAREADVVIQGYRPGSLAKRGIDPAEIAKVNPGVVFANLSAFGPEGEWKDRRGFDSLVQACCGINVSEAEHYYFPTTAGEADARGAVGDKEWGEKMPAKPLPCQALDHGAGYLLATGICAALYHRERDRAGTEEGKPGEGVAGAYVVDVSLAGVAKYLRSLGQYPGREGFEGYDLTVLNGPGEKEDVEKYFEIRATPFGEMRFLRHSASVAGMEPRWDRMPTPLGSDTAAWSVASEA